MQEQDDPQVFISYANPDQDRVTPFFDSLEEKGFNVWYDCRRLKPGQNWDFEIRRALEKSNVVIVFLSENSLRRRGYVQRELKEILDKQSEKLIDDIYIIPVLLDDTVEIPPQIKGIQCISASAPNCINRVEEALTFQLARLGVEKQKLQRKEEIGWTYHTKKEIWDGLPGYEVELQFIKFSSSKYPALSEAGEFIQGELLKCLFSCRSSQLDQSPDLFNYAQERYSRTNTYDAHCSEPLLKGRVLTVQYAIHLYGACAAHPNLFFRTYSFVMKPLILIESLERIFHTPERALSKLQDCVRKELKSTKIGGEEDEFLLDAECVDNGTQDWSDFGSFIFKEDCIEFLFAPYHVAAYACGPQFAEVAYTELIQFMRPEYQSALEIEHLAYQQRQAAQPHVGANGGN